MNNKFYQSARRVLSHRLCFGPCLFGLGAQLLLSGCSSQGSAFGGGSGGSDTAPGGAAGVSGDVGGATTSSGGDTSGGGVGGIPPTTGAGGAGPGAGGNNGQSSGGTAGNAGGAGGGGTASGGSAGGGDVCPKPAGQICHEFFANDNSKNQTHYVNEFFPSKNWTVSVGDSGQNSPRGAQLVDNTKAKAGKAVLVSIDKGFAEFDMADGTLLNKVTSFGSVTSAIRIPIGATATQFAGATVIARDLTPPEIDIVDSTGKSLSPALKLSFAVGTELRKLERNPTTGNFSLTKYESGTTAYIYEFTEQGSQVAKIRLPSGAKGYNAIWVDGGHIMATTGYLATVVTLDANGAVVGTPLGGIGALKDAAGATIYSNFYSGFFRMPNGNVIAANWLGHVDPSTHPTTPELLEIAPGNQLVWSWGNQSIATYVTYGYFLR